ncbi:hypothetical protein [Falsiroseomonas sp. E2-1-a4]|uniref:hypothetical protein n=1 Tax=Falsiroseomonas sp. E2-1-a4 TaxID=3239299 RepID=UPI003F2DDA75
MSKKSLLLLGFPRSFTSEAYRIAASALTLDRTQARAGEALNSQMWPELCPDSIKNIHFYDNTDANYPAFAEILDRFSREPGFILKDVVQPFHALRYVKENPDKFTAFYVKRSVPDVVSRIKKQGWRYVHSINYLEERYSRLPILDAARMMYDHEYIFRKLRSFGYDAQGFNYIDQNFIKTREAVLDDIELIHDIPSPPAVSEWPSLHPSTIYQFSRAAQTDTARSMLNFGWSLPEQDGTWTDGRHARLLFSVSALPKGGTLELELSSYKGSKADGIIRLSNAVTGEARSISYVVRGKTTVSLELAANSTPTSIKVEIFPDSTIVAGRTDAVRSLAARGVLLSALKIIDLSVVAG